MPSKNEIDRRLAEELIGRFGTSRWILSLFSFSNSYAHCAPVAHGA
jgi:hypothetical protein